MLAAGEEKIVGDKIHALLSSPPRSADAAAATSPGPT
jgi:hypothetical protein